MQEEITKEDFIRILSSGGKPVSTPGLSPATKENLKRFFAVVETQWCITQKRLGTNLLPGIIEQPDKPINHTPKYPHAGYLKPNQSPDDVTISPEEFRPILDILRTDHAILDYLNIQAERAVDVSSSINEEILWDCDKPAEWLLAKGKRVLPYAFERNEALRTFLILKDTPEIPEVGTIDEMSMLDAICIPFMPHHLDFLEALKDCGIDISTLTEKTIYGKSFNVVRCTNEITLILAAVIRKACIGALGLGNEDLKILQNVYGFQDLLKRKAQKAGIELFNDGTIFASIKEIMESRKQEERDAISKRLFEKLESLDGKIEATQLKPGTMEAPEPGDGKQETAQNRGGDSIVPAKGFVQMPSLQAIADEIPCDPGTITNRLERNNSLWCGAIKSICGMWYFKRADKERLHNSLQPKGHKKKKPPLTPS